MRGGGIKFLFFFVRFTILEKGRGDKLFTIFDSAENLIRSV